jgi:hypothetical protein
LQWNINRWYDAKVGRWCSEYPIGFEGKDENLTRYIRNKVLLHNDSWGLKLEQTGVRYCTGWEKGAWTLGGIMPTHWFIAIDGVGIGKFGNNLTLSTVREGELRFDDLLIYFSHFKIRFFNFFACGNFRRVKCVMHARTSLCF